MCVTVLASQPSVSIETETTHFTCSPSLPGLPTVFITSRRRSSSVSCSASRPGKRARYSSLNSSISRAAIFLKSSLIASPDSSCSLSIRMELGRARHCAVLFIAEDGQLAGHDDRRAIGQGLLPAGDVVKDHLGNIGVVADHDEHRRGLAVFAGLGVLLPLAGNTSRSCCKGFEARPQAPPEASARLSMASVPRPFFGRCSRMRSQRSR